MLQLKMSVDVCGSDGLMVGFVLLILPSLPGGCEYATQVLSATAVSPISDNSEMFRMRCYQVLPYHLIFLLP